MRLDIALIFAGIAVSSASASLSDRQLPQLPFPACGTDCYIDSVAGLDCGPSLDLCICDYNGALDTFTSCVRDACPPNLALECLEIVDQACKEAIDFSLPAE
ncbi:uncharacterized protein FOMMEDRAFT_156976 [Fomitiporia mediterranea MF3/22]|uniref:uncharacterized protein n=1 Tax=Fomitiporia mediterranea (strain MF3/22) TaxID=694068 RepID=UPI0004408538|nr:uncharacterized protein FOMMEDRAFT_156976 [Fomitiporia mediterranea MF3/22]EJD01849.1 hypothetical protein FOMMEDRAFT_156976 [Fomitiporia mediterranea MF3/22]